MNMKRISFTKSVWALLKLTGTAALALAFIAVMAGCTTSTYITESAFAFPEEFPVKNLTVGSFTYDTGHDYLVCPDGSLIRDRFLQTEHEAYHREPVIDSDGKPKMNQDGKPMTKLVLNDGYRAASADEVHSWACRTAAENAGITNIIAIKSFTAAIFKNFGVFGIHSRLITITVYGEVLPERTE
jgi:hypothetical protein